MVGDGAPILVRRALTRSGLETVAARRARALPGIYDRRLMNHTRRTTAWSKASAVVVQRGPLAVLTNKPLGPSIGILEALGLRGFFSRIIGGDGEYGRKPDPAGLLALQALAPGDQLVMVGDSPADWKAAQAAARAVRVGALWLRGGEVGATAAGHGTGDRSCPRDSMARSPPASVRL